jgi:hypothetical protein
MLLPPRPRNSVRPRPRVHPNPFNLPPGHPWALTADERRAKSIMYLERLVEVARQADARQAQEQQQQKAKEQQQGKK